MSPEQEQRVLERLAFVVESRKTFDAKPHWDRVPSRTSERWQMAMSLRIGGLLGPVTARIFTPIDAWEGEVYAQLEVRGLGLPKPLRLLPIEWNPLHHHDNPRDAPSPHAGLRLFDRYMPFDLNAERGIGVFAQTRTAVMVDLPRLPTDFTTFCDLCSDIWRCSDMLDLEPPPWSRPML